MLLLLSVLRLAQQGTPKQINLTISELKPYGLTFYTFTVRNNSDKYIKVAAQVEGEAKSLIALSYPGKIIKPTPLPLAAAGATTKLERGNIPKRSYKHSFIEREILAR